MDRAAIGGTRSPFSSAARIASPRRTPMGRECGYGKDGYWRRRRRRHHHHLIQDHQAPHDWDLSIMAAVGEGGGAF